MIKVKFKDGTEEIFQNGVCWSESDDADELIDITDYKDNVIASININEIRFISEK